MIKQLIVVVLMLLQETKIPSEAESLELVRLKPSQSVTSSNKQKCKWIPSVWNILNCRKKCDFLK